MSEGVTVGKVGSYGMSATDYLAQIWQMLYSARTGAFPFVVDDAGSETLAQILAASSIVPVADGTYTVGLGVTTNGTITVKSGVVTAITQAS